MEETDQQHPIQDDPIIIHPLYHKTVNGSSNDQFEMNYWLKWIIINYLAHAAIAVEAEIGFECLAREGRQFHQLFVEEQDPRHDLEPSKMKWIIDCLNPLAVPSEAVNTELHGNSFEIALKLSYYYPDAALMLTWCCPDAALMLPRYWSWIPDADLQLPHN